ncbi:uncharacterized protein LOC142583319 [Dermacentor variabilis]|uniref:uncharacterized protein LOC142583319 n=1 Tax=Dermacentor variabilis TaxID=34621 RepID=UPI003F5B7008
MHLKVMLPVLVAFVVAVVGSSAVDAQEFAGCPIVDDKGANVTFLPNLFNCSTFYMCSQGLPVLMECPRGLRFNHALNVCDNPWKTACIELPLPAPKPPSTEAPVVAEKIVTTKTVKEVYEPVDETAW